MADETDLLMEGISFHCCFFAKSKVADERMLGKANHLLCISDQPTGRALKAALHATDFEPTKFSRGPRAGLRQDSWRNRATLVGL
jgi:hypothetical protein